MNIMKKKPNGFGISQFIVGMTILVILLGFGAYYVVCEVGGPNYSMFKKEAESFAHQVVIHKEMVIRADNIYYLDYLLDKKVDVIVKNPFGSDACNRYESYVKTENGKETVLRCGEYLAHISNDVTTIYKVGDWLEKEDEKITSIESRLLYNYEKNGVVMSDKYMIENEFIDFYNEKEGTNYYSVNAIQTANKGIKILSKTFHRLKEEVKVIK